jgi:hypothetical protein
LSDQEGKTIELYRELCARYSTLMHNPMGTMVRELFDRKYRGCPISELKEIDFVFWQLRLLAASSFGSFVLSANSTISFEQGLPPKFFDETPSS